MRLTALTVAAAGLLAAPVGARQPPADQPAEAAADCVTPTILDPDALRRGVSVQLIAGLPSGVRVGVPFAAGHHWYAQAEAFAGGVVLPGPIAAVETVSMVGGGGRWVWEVTRDGDPHALLVGPGLGAHYVTGGDRSTAIGIADVTLGWVPDRLRRGCFELGVDLGLGFNNRGVIPIDGLYAGFHF